MSSATAVHMNLSLIESYVRKMIYSGGRLSDVRNELQGRSQRSEQVLFDLESHFYSDTESAPTISTFTHAYISQISLISGINIAT